MTPSDPVWHVAFSVEAPYMNIDPRNLLTNSEYHQSFSLGQVGFWVNGVTIYILTPSDLFLTFDPHKMIDFFACLINAYKMSYDRSRSEHVLTFTSVKFNDP